MDKVLQIAVIGGRKEDKHTLDAAQDLGALIAAKGWQLICGGLGGVMKAACQGAAKANGVTIGILPGRDRTSANRYISIPIATGIGVARNSILAHSADAAVAVGGKYGTLSEIAYFLQMGKPVITLRSIWTFEGTLTAETAEEAIVLIENSLCRNGR